MSFETTIVNDLKTFESYFGKIARWLKAKFKNLPSKEVQISSVANYLVPVVEELDTLVIPELAPVINPFLEKLKTGLAALAVTITDATPAGKANVLSILNSLKTNAAQLESAFQVKDPATQAKITGAINIIAGEVSAVQAQLSLTASATNAATA